MFKTIKAWWKEAVQRMEDDITRPPLYKRPVTISKMLYYLNWLGLDHPKNKNALSYPLRTVYHKIEFFPDGEGAIREITVKRSKRLPYKMSSISEQKIVKHFDTFQQLEDIIREYEDKKYGKAEKS